LNLAQRRHLDLLALVNVTNVFYPELVVSGFVIFSSVRYIRVGHAFIETQNWKMRFGI